jgi:predicted Zn-dependent protease
LCREVFILQNPLFEELMMIRLNPTPTRAVAAGLMAALCILCGCSTNPATGRPQLALISEQQEIQLGRDFDQEIQRLLGVYPDPRLQEYVDRVGRKLAAGSERPDLGWTFRVVDDPVVNAFALPGGHVYVTRGLMTHLTSEAQLAAVIGHEIGHVTARHSVTQMSKARIARIGLIAGSLISPSLAGAAARGLEVLFLKYSREDERQADDLGLRYMFAQGYDPREMPRVFEVLRRVSQGQEGQRIPEWQSTHPSEEERVRATSAAVARLGNDFPGRAVSREEYLRSLDHLAFGQNPREGYFLRSTFVQPTLAAQIRFPEGWKTANGRSSVEAVAPKQDAVLVMSLSGETSWRKAAREFFLHEGSQNGETLATDVNGLPGGWCGPSASRARMPETCKGSPGSWSMAAASTRSSASRGRRTGRPIRRLCPPPWRASARRPTAACSTCSRSGWRSSPSPPP